MRYSPPPEGAHGSQRPDPGTGVAAIARYVAEAGRTMLRRRRRVEAMLVKALPTAPTLLAPLIIAIDGRSGSGKTLLAEAVAVELRARMSGAEVPQDADTAGEVVVVALEDMYHGWDGLEAGLHSVRHLLKALACGRPGCAARWDWHLGRQAGEVCVGSADHLPAVVIVEGCGAGSDVLAPVVDMLVWVEVPESTRRARTKARDGAWDYPWEDWAKQEDALLARRDAAEAADLVVGTRPRAEQEPQ